MKKTIIGIPRAFLYYRYKVLWKVFFKTLNCKIIISDITTKATINNGKKYSVDEACLSSKIYIGHIYNLIGKCDYILIPRICDYGKNEKVCINFNACYDVIKNTFPHIQILNYNIENTKKNYEFISLIKLGLKINKNIFKVLYSYLKAKHMEKKYKKNKLYKQNQKLNNQKTKILLISHPYNTYDNYIGLPIIKQFKKLNMDIIYSDITPQKQIKKLSKKLSPTLYWTYSKELISSIEFYKNYISGIIYITSFPCGPDSLVNELIIRKITNIPSLNLVVDEQTSSTGIETRIESFVDIIKERG